MTLPAIGYVQSRVRALRSDEGGRQTPIISEYRGQFYFNGENWDAIHNFKGGRIAPGETNLCHSLFESSERLLSSLYVGAEFELREGARTVAKGVVTRILRESDSRLESSSENGSLGIVSKDTVRRLAETKVPVVALSNYAVQQMMEAGIVIEGAPIELIGGVLVWKDRSDRGKDALTVGYNHIFLIKRFTDMIAQINCSTVHMYCQNPVMLTDVDVPEPDAAIVKGSAEDYRGNHPGPREIFCVIEISDSSLHFDRTVKLALYAAANIPQYVIINIPDRQIEVYEGPQPNEGRYATQTILKAGDTLELNTGTGARFKTPVAELLPA